MPTCDRLIQTLAKKIDITIVVDMLLTGFDSKYLNTLYVDKNLKYHGLIQAFSRTNRVLNGTKPYGNILDFRQQQRPMWTPPLHCSLARNRAPEARKIWLVDTGGRNVMRRSWTPPLPSIAALHAEARA